MIIKRTIGWIGISAVLALMGGAAIATPMGDKDYATQVALEVDYQNTTCADLEYLRSALKEMLNKCAPADAFGGTLATVPVFTRSGRSAPPPPPPQPFTYTPPRVCPDTLPPTYRISPELYAQLGPTVRAYLASAGIPWDVDIQPGEYRGRSPSSQQTYFSAPISALDHQLDAAGALKNCRPL